MSNRHTWLSLAALLLMQSCEKLDLTTEDDGEDETAAEYVIPTSTGEGTPNSPLTVKEVLSRSDSLTSHTIWVVGYVVGSTYRSMSNASFDSITTNTSNILLSYKPDCTSTSQCLPVELPTAKLQRALSLASNSEKFRQCAMVFGSVERYFGNTGIRSTQQAYWLPGFVVSDISPTDWEVEERPY